MKLFVLLLLSVVLSSCYYVPTENISSTTKQYNTPVPTQERPQDIPGSLLHSVSCTGDSVIQSITIDCPSIFIFNTQDDRYHSVKAYYGDVEYDYDLLVNSTDPYSGILYLMCDRVYDIVVSCNGYWEAEIYSIGYTSETSFSGSGDYVTSICLPADKYYNITYTGDDHFSVKQYYGYSEYDYELLVNEIGSYSGTVRLAYSEDLCFFVISGEEGSWTISPIE